MDAIDENTNNLTPQTQPEKPTETQAADDNTVVLSEPVVLTIAEKEQTVTQLTVKEINVAEMVAAHEGLTDDLDTDDALLAAACGVPLDVIDELTLADQEAVQLIFNRLNATTETQAQVEASAMQAVVLESPYKSDAGIPVQQLTVTSIKVKFKKQAQRNGDGNQARVNAAMVAYACQQVPEDIYPMKCKDFMKLFARFLVHNTYRPARPVEATGSPAG